jgi:tRNA pseudouridine38-40 synthase
MTERSSRAASRSPREAHGAGHRGGGTGGVHRRATARRLRRPDGRRGACHGPGGRAEHDARRTDPETFRDALNHFLPEDVAVRAAAEVAVDFDPRRDATSRVYRYRIEHGRVRSPLGRHRAWQVERPLDVSTMAVGAGAAAAGERDWAAFAGRRPGGVPHRADACFEARIERVRRARCGGDAGSHGFLPHQVRRMVGALERVGHRGLTPGSSPRWWTDPRRAPVRPRHRRD